MACDRRLGRRATPHATEWTVEVEIAEPTPVTACELDVFERYFAEIIDAVFDPAKSAATGFNPSVAEADSAVRRPLDRRGKMR